MYFKTIIVITNIIIIILNIFLKVFFFMKKFEEYKLKFILISFQILQF